MTGNNDACVNMAYEDEEAAEDTEATTSWQTAYTKTFTMTAGDYIIMISAIAYNSLGYVGSHYRVQMDNSIDILPDSMIGMINVGEVALIFAIKKVNIAADGDHTFDFDIKSSGGGEVAKISDKRIACIRVSL